MVRSSSMAVIGGDEDELGSLALSGDDPEDLFVAWEWLEKCAAALLSVASFLLLLLWGRGMRSGFSRTALTGAAFL